MSGAEPKPRPRVMLVEEDARTGRRLAAMLREEGYDVDLALDGAVAIALLSRSPRPAVLVTNLNVAAVDGLTIARYARSRFQELPVVVVTGYPHLLHAGEPLEPPPILFTKPVDYAELTRTLDRITGGRGATSPVQRQSTAPTD